MEKTPMYAVVTPSRPQKPRWVPWAAATTSVVALIVAVATAIVLKQQSDRVTFLEEKVSQMEIHMEQVLQFTHEFFEYDEDAAEDSQGGQYEELTVRGVVRKKRQASDDDDDAKNGGVPIYDQAYGVNLNNRFNSEGLRLYESFVENREGEPRSAQVSWESESGIKPYHKVSNLWVPKKRRQRYPSGSSPELSSRNELSREDDANNDSTDYEDDEDDQVINIQTRSRMPMVERRSRVKSLHGAGSRSIRRQKASRDHSNQNPVSVLFRDSFAKATERHDGQSPGLNSVVPQASPSALSQMPTVVEQTPRGRHNVADALVRPYIGKEAKKKKPRKKQGRRISRRRARPALSLGHFVAAPANRTSHHVSNGIVHDEWSPAAWMDKLGLNRKYTLRRGTVTVKESGLYYLYAQVLYESGRFGSGFQILVDGISVMECTLTPSNPPHSCHTSGTTYLQRNAEVSIRDKESHVNAVRREANSFFGLIKLMDAPETAEKLLLG